MDLLLTNGSVVTDGVEFTADLAVKDGVVRAVGDLSGLKAAETVDCSGRILLPGAVDLGVNLLADGGFSPTSSADSIQAMRSAAMGGVTTVISAISIPNDKDFVTTLRALQDADSKAAVIDFGYHLGLGEWSASSSNRVRDAVAAGMPSFWIANTDLETELPSPSLLQSILPDMPEGTLVIISSYDAVQANFLKKKLLSRGAVVSSRWKEACSDSLEAGFLKVLPYFAQGTRARVLVSGISGNAALEAFQEARGENPSILGACGLTHLVYTDNDEAAPRVWPPVRGKSDQSALYAALEEGLLSVIVSGHKPRTAAEAASIGEADALPPAGAATLQHFMPALHGEGVVKYRLSLGGISQAASADPAKLAGLYPKKGSLQIGSDADIVVIDPGVSRKPPEAGDFADPLGGISYQGGISAVYLRGKRIVESDKIVGEPGGAFLQRRMAIK